MREREKERKSAQEEKRREEKRREEKRRKEKRREEKRAGSGGLDCCLIRTLFTSCSVVWRTTAGALRASVSP
jgi:hypothetical protein